MSGGDAIAEVLRARGVPCLFTLCGGHISPILVAARARGIGVLDVRDERSAVFAADAQARLSGSPGVAVVTAGPGATNAVTAVKNAQLAQSPVVLLGGATATLLRGRGSLQDIDQRALLEPHVKWWGRARRVRHLVPLLEHALRVAGEGVPGPVFLECPVDLLYGREVVAEWYRAAAGKGTGLAARARRAALRWHARRLFAGRTPAVAGATRVEVGAPPVGAIRRVARRLRRASRPLLLVGSQATLQAARVEAIATAVERLGVPAYLSGMARGLLGAASGLQLRHQRRKALREADLVLLAGVPCDFRLDYGRHLRGSFVVSANRSRHDLFKSRRPDRPLLCDPGAFLLSLAELWDDAAPSWTEWKGRLSRREAEREEQIDAMAAEGTEHLNPLALCREIDAALDEKSVLVADGGDFVATASYTVRPRGPLSWLDPGVFGTLGVGGGFALGAAACRPDSEIWLLYGDGSAAFSLAEFDTFARHGLGVIGVVGNDASWAQIARDQVEILGDPVGTVLARTDYHRVAEGYGGRGLLLDRPERTAEVLAEAKEIARSGVPVLVNAWLGRTDFRKGSLSM